MQLITRDDLLASGNLLPMQIKVSDTSGDISELYLANYTNQGSWYE